MFGAFALLVAGLAHSQATLSVTPGSTQTKTEGETQAYTGTLSQVSVDQTVTLRFGIFGDQTASRSDYRIVDANGNPLSTIVLTYSNTSVPANQSQTFNFSIEVVDDNICEFAETIRLKFSASAAVQGGSVTPTTDVFIDIRASDGGPACPQPVSPRAGFRAVWESTLTVDDHPTNTRFRGCSNITTGVNACSTALTDDDFTLGGTDYTVNLLFYSFLTGIQNNTLQLWVTGSGALPADSTLRTSDYVLRVGDYSTRDVKSFAKSGVTFGTSRHRIYWGGSAPVWGTGAEIGIRLEVAASTDTTLSALSGNGSTDGSSFSVPLALAPSFSAEQLAYSASVASNVEQIKLTPTTTHNDATVQMGTTPDDLAAVTGGAESAAYTLTYGANTILAVVTAEDEFSKQTYTLTVTRVDPSSSLDQLTVNGSTDENNFSPIALTPSFSTQQLTYMASVDQDVTQVKLTPTATDSAATVQVGTLGNLATVATGAESEAIQLNTDDATTTILVVVTASNNSSTQTYTLTVTVMHAGVAEQLHRAALPEVARAVAGRVTGAISARAGQALNGRGGIVSASLGGQSTLAGALQTHAPGVINENRSLRDLLHGSNFVLPLNGGGDGGGGNGLGSVSVWGNGEYRNLSGEDGDLEFDGDMYGAQIGVDAKVRENLLAGVALSWSRGELEYEDSSAVSGGVEGDYEVNVVALHPYLGGRSGTMEWWATAGYGSGEVEITPDSGNASSNDVNMKTLGAGGSGLLWSRAEDGARVHIKGEFTRTRMNVEKNSQIDSLSVDANLVRIALAASRTRSLAGGGGGQLSPSLSLGVRQDSGDGNIGTGAEVRGGVRYDNAQSGVSASVSAHTLLGRSDYEEWGVQALVRLSPGADGQGLSFEMSPGYGNGGGSVGTGDTGRIWSNGLRGDAIPTAHDASGRLEMRLGYGLSTPGGRDGLLTPWSGLTLRDDGKLYRMGLDWSSGGQFTLRLHGERHENENADADHAILLKGETRF